MSKTTVDKPVRRRRLTELARFVERRIDGWQQAYLRRSQSAMATLAQLRRGAGKEVGAIPELWKHTLEGLPVQHSAADAPTPDERAAHTAFTLFAIHQQSRQAGMHQPGQSLGTAVRQLRARSASELAVSRRFEALGTAETFNEAVHHARGLITQLRAHGIPLDYGQLTDDLLWIQLGGGDRVRLQWGRDFYRNPKSDSDDQDSSAADAAPTSEEAA